MTKPYLPFTPADSANVLIDHQPGVLGMAGSLPAEAVTRNAATLARLGEELDIPLVITSTRENLEFLGTTLQAIQDAAPKAYDNRIRRAGTLNAFDGPAFVSALADTGRRRLVLAGLLTDVWLSTAHCPPSPPATRSCSPPTPAPPAASSPTPSPTTACAPSASRRPAPTASCSSCSRTSAPRRGSGPRGSPPAA